MELHQEYTFWRLSVWD